MAKQGMGPLRSKAEVLNCASRSAEETQQLGHKLGELARPGDVILLVGDLGAGKTTMTQGIARGLGVDEYTGSPSFVLVREYKGRLSLYHVDLYRLARVAEIDDLGLDDYFYGNGLSVVEWADRGLAILPPENLLVSIEHNGMNERVLLFEAKGKRYVELLEGLRPLCHGHEP